MLISLFATPFLFNNYTAIASENSNGNFDDAIENVISGIDEKEFEFITENINNLFGENKSFKEIILSFITGENGLNFDTLKSFISASYLPILTDVLSIVFFVIFIGLSYSILNIINYKKCDNTVNNIIYFICYFTVVIVFSKLVSEVFNIGKTATENVNKIVEITFPIMITLSEFSGGFGMGIYKPLAYVLTVISSEIVINFFIPIFSICFISVIIGNLSENIKLSSLNKTLLTFIKWCVGILTSIFSLVLAGQGLVNSQYNGISFKVLKYATGSIIPIVGNFISGGLDVLLSSTVLVKNSIGIMAVICILFCVLRAGITILITSFIIKIAISICEPVLDDKFIKLTGGVCEVFNVFTAVIFAIGFIFLISYFAFINSTAL
ncbi:MAG: stage III sporulation protein AE, partial [Clostridia bacterium]|nr:stage III sporulation protein AE [Clostridia bacterium]